MDMVQRESDNATQWRCIHEECERKHDCVVFQDDYVPYIYGWIKFFKAFPSGDSCYHFRQKGAE
jgi:hypothetical protein